MAAEGSVFSATRWTAAAVFASIAAQFAQMAILSRILPAADIGLIAIVAIVNSLAEVLVGLGISQSIIQRQHVSRQELSSLHWLNTAAALSVVLLIIFLSGPITLFFSVSGSAALLQIAAWSVLFSALGQVPRAGLEKRMTFQKVAVSEIVGAGVLIGVSTPLAISGFGAYSAAVALIASSISRSAILWVGLPSELRPGLHFRLSETRRFLSFGALQAIDSMLSFAVANASTIVTGRVIGVSAMGGYSLVNILTVTLPMRVNAVVNRVTFPAFSSFQTDHGRIRRAYAQVLTTVGLVNAPALLVMAVIPEDVLTAGFGPEWARYAPVLALLALAGVLRAFGNPVGALLMATNNMRLGLMLNVIKATYILPSVVLGGIYGGIVGVAIASLASQAVSFTISAWVTNRTVALRTSSFLRACATPILLAMPTVATVAVGRALLDETTRGWPTIGLLTIPACLVLLATLWASRNATILNLRSRLLNQRQRSVVAVTVPPRAARYAVATDSAVRWARKIEERLGESISVLAVTREGPLGRVFPSVYARFWTWHMIPRLHTFAIVHIHNDPRTAAALLRSGYDGKVILHIHDGGVRAALERHRRVLSEVHLLAVCSQRSQRTLASHLGKAPAILGHGSEEPARTPRSDREGYALSINPEVARDIEIERRLQRVGVVVSDGPEIPNHRLPIAHLRLLGAPDRCEEGARLADAHGTPVVHLDHHDVEAVLIWSQGGAQDHSFKMVEDLNLASNWERHANESIARAARNSWLTVAAMYYETVIEGLGRGLGDDKPGT